MKSVRPIFKTKLLIYQSKDNLDAEILFGKIAYGLDPEIREILVKLHIWEQGFLIQFWSIVSLRLKLEFYF